MVMRSATAPDTMVAAVPQNTSWKTKNVIDHASVEPKARRSASKPTQPPTLVPNIRAKPTRPKHMAERSVSSRFFCATLTAFLARTLPASRSRNPACIMKTMPAATVVQTWSRLV